MIVNVHRNIVSVLGLCTILLFAYPCMTSALKKKISGKDHGNSNSIHILYYVMLYYYVYMYILKKGKRTMTSALKKGSVHKMMIITIINVL